MKKFRLPNISFNELFNHFYNSHETVLVYDEHEILRGAITYTSFINSDSILDMIRNVLIINDESEIEVGDLANIYCIKDGNYFKEVCKLQDT